MKEIYGDLWAYEDRPGFKICITTNGFIKKDGTGVMGAGVARQAAEKDPELPRLLGHSLKTRGNVVSLLTPNLISFPVKHNWYEEADLDLIRTSAKELARRAKLHPSTRYILPRPGCGNGGLQWAQVLPIMAKYFGQLDNVYIIEREKHGGKVEKGWAASRRTTGGKVQSTRTRNLRT